MEEGLTMEQRFLLQRLALEAKEMSKEELLHALLESWEMRFHLKQSFLSTTREAGYMFKMEERRPIRQPETEEDLIAAIGHMPTDEEVHDYMRGMWENATMELDMDEIVLGQYE